MSSLESPYPGDKGESRARSRAGAFRRIQRGSDADGRRHRPLPPGCAADRGGRMVADDRRTGGAATVPALL